MPPMAFEAILAEAGRLHNVSNRLEALADQHPPVSDALMTISGSVFGGLHVCAPGAWARMSRTFLRPEAA